MKNIEQLRDQLKVLRQSGEKLRTRDLAKHLKISEAELLSLSIGEQVIRLTGDWKQLLQSLHALGYVMVLTRNEYCVHERKGLYENVTFYEGAHNMGVAVNPDIDLRFFMNEWKYGFAVKIQRSEHQVLHSFQFFNQHGEAVHKVFATNKSNLDAYQKLIAFFKHEQQTPLMDVQTATKSTDAPLPDSEIDVHGFQTAWRNLQDTHDFFGMLKKFNVTRTQGLRLAPEGFTQPVANDTVVQMLEKAANREIPIMCFVHSSGCVQIHSGPVKNLKWYGDWYNVMDKEFNLHLDTKGIAETWIVKKPTVDGIVTSIELFDADGQLIVYFFGARKPGKPELQTWRELMEELPLSPQATIEIPQS